MFTIRTHRGRVNGVLDKVISSPDAAGIKTFRLSLQPPGTADPANWSDVYSRQNGSCHWIAAILRN